MDQVAASPVVAGGVGAPVVFRRSPSAEIGGAFGAAIGAIGINETELPKDFDRLVELTRTYVQVRDGAPQSA